MGEPFKPASTRLSWGVAALLNAVSDSLQARFAVVQVEGELSGFTRAASGHCYFSLKDADGAAAMLRCAMFRRAASLTDFAPADGQRVELRGRLALYEPRGELQFIVEAMRRAGAGALYEQFLRLKARLEAQGLFDPSRKRELPAFATRIGVITSLAGAALHDVLTTLARRAPHVQVIVYPSLVQGAEAPAALLQALAQANARAEVDLLLLCRGGGSLEDLWAFNDERLVRAIAESALPVVCGVGHETDVTLADLAADLRAPTPTAAAELATPSRAACMDQLAALARTLMRRMDQRLDAHAQRLDRAALRLARPSDALARQRRRIALLAQRWGQVLPRLQAMQQQKLQHLEQRWRRALPQALQHQADRLQTLQARLAALDPKQVLARGYAWLDDGQGRALTSVAQLQPGQDLHAVLADGEAQLRVQTVKPARTRRASKAQ
ncbi:exodeoxyribonuclease VII large subunit [Paucibacter sp. APW11]|uniref:Exodeoxyribonuclease 7 large subunit n=1 Tax=Roseateles aquae TaxID=3077235 RepID=A0ABU3P9D1_9BURK|nr:exodeoxyribonuclease VII large subunit [Paucibacter sp. APW11]MDT8999181.1 exodeoxyribonuclease VII large subunit [Paucibacter sp. APW11]